MEVSTGPPDGRGIPRHAIERWRERVEPGSSRADALSAIRQFLHTATVGRVVPSWLRDDQIVYRPPLIARNERWPGVVLVLASDTELPLTVITQQMKWEQRALARRQRKREQRQMRERMRAIERSRAWRKQRAAAG